MSFSKTALRGGTCPRSYSGASSPTTKCCGRTFDRPWTTGGYSSPFRAPYTRAPNESLSNSSRTPTTAFTSRGPSSPYFFYIPLTIEGIRLTKYSLSRESFGREEERARRRCVCRRKSARPSTKCHRGKVGCPSCS